MHASAPQRILNGRLGHFVHPLCRLAGIDPRRCFCIRCSAARSGIYHRTRTWVADRAYVDVYVFGIRIRHSLAFEQPMATPPRSPGATSRERWMASGRSLRPGLTTATLCRTRLVLLPAIVALGLTAAPAVAQQQVSDTGGRVYGLVGGSFGDGRFVATGAGAGLRLSRHLGLDVELTHMSDGGGTRGAEPWFGGTSVFSAMSTAGAAAEDYPPSALATTSCFPPSASRTTEGT